MLLAADAVVVPVELLLPARVAWVDRRSAVSADVVAPRAAVSIEVTSTPVLSYALAHNRIPVINRLALTSDCTVRGAMVRLGVRRG